MLDQVQDVKTTMADLGRRARKAAAALAIAPTETKNAALAAMADAIEVDHSSRGSARYGHDATMSSKRGQPPRRYVSKSYLPIR